ncbi:MAG: hypothetical protein CSA58_00410 [Micrococcales bacterium]|nr:MAG: hypothetical protein CSB46_03335 [Micrococcales bacterium]PIE28168.1 MAG: hypothetical protein CSA58_00410 [Micrococcales bacterium]
MILPPCDPVELSAAPAKGPDDLVSLTTEADGAGTARSAAVAAAAEHVAALVPAAILNHSRRCYRYAVTSARAAGLEESSYNDELLYLVCLFHDVAVSAGATSGSFEQASAAHATAFMREHGFGQSEISEVQQAITTPTPGPDDTVLARLIRHGILADAGHNDLVQGATRTRVEARLPRLDYETLIDDAMLAHALSPAPDVTMIQPRRGD